MTNQTLPQQDFAYATGRLRALENFLLNNNEIDRMVLAQNAEEAYKILNELDYSSHIGDIESVDSFQEVLDSGLKDTKALVRKSVTHRWILNMIWFRFDFHNIKTLLKAKMLGKTFEEIEAYLIPLGAIEIKDLADYIFKGEFSGFNIWPENAKYIKESIDKAEEAFQKNNDSFAMDTDLDRKCLTLIHRVAEHTKSEFLIKFIKKYIDLQNISAFIRLKYYERHDTDQLKKILSKHGTLDRDTLVSLGKKEMNEFIEYARKTDYDEIVKKAIEGYEKEKSFHILEQEIENCLTRQIQDAKRISMGPEPVVAYFWAKNNNAIILRMIMVGKLNGLNAEEIKERLHDLYTN